MFIILQAIQLKAICWPEELAGMSDNKKEDNKKPKARML